MDEGAQTGPGWRLGQAGQGFAVVGIGASAGGLEALHEVLRDAGRDQPVAYVVIQHLDPTHDSVMAELLDRRTALSVQQAADGVEVQPGHVYTIPPGHGLAIRDGRLHLVEFDQPRGLRRPIDDFFESLAQDQGPRAACVILSGTGADGTRGLRAIKENGGLCVVQEPRTARYDGMPMSAKSTGLVDFVLPPTQIVPAILQFFGSYDPKAVDDVIVSDARRICELLRESCGHDFSGYKMSTLVRRIRRRMQVLGLSSSQKYLEHLADSCGECEALLNEFLINVTRFFRDAEAFEVLRDKAIRPLIERAGGEELRVWVPGCSSGEEAYSIAMLIDHEMRQAGRAPRFTVFASDIDKHMIDIARTGAYPLSAMADIPEHLRAHYTTHRDAQMQITPQLRDRVRFSLHSLVRDPPFARVDLVSCRNLLIYLTEDLQAKVLPAFHYSLRPGGFLFLGSSEGVRREAAHFTEVDRAARLFRRDDSVARLPLELQLGGHEMLPPATPSRPGSDIGTGGGDHRPSYRASGASAQQRVLDHFVPASLQLSPQGEVLWSAGRLGRYITVDPAGTRPVMVTAIVHPGLKDAVSGALAQVVANGRAVVVRDLQAQSELGLQPVTLFAEPLPDRTILMVFQDAGALADPDDGGDERDEMRISESRTNLLEEELRLTQIELHGTVEELETANEELKSSNEEMMSMNEELQSTNEELSTVNDELKSKIDDLTIANSDLQNFFLATKIPLLVVDREVRIRNFTNAALQIFPLRRSDHGRPLANVSNVFGDARLEALAADVAETGEARVAELREPRNGRIWRVDVKPYHRAEDVLDGAILILEDITPIEKLRQEVVHQATRLQAVREMARITVWECDPADGTLVIDDSANLLGVGRTASLPLSAFSLLIAPADRAGLIAQIENCANGKGAMQRIIAPSRESAMPVRLAVVAERLASGKVLGVMHDVTAAEAAVQLREAVIAEMDHRVKNIFTQVASMLRMAGREFEDVDEVVSDVSGRLMAMARSHALTTRQGPDAVLGLGDLLTTALAPYSGAQVSLNGPEVQISRRDVVPLSLIVHELSTNAYKYGVLGQTEGCLRVDWQHVDGQLRLEWSEVYAGAGPHRGSDGGFGSLLLEGASQQLSGTLAVDARADARVTTLTFQPTLPPQPED